MQAEGAQKAFYNFLTDLKRSYSTSLHPPPPFQPTPCLFEFHTLQIKWITNTRLWLLKVLIPQKKYGFLSARLVEREAGRLKATNAN